MGHGLGVGLEAEMVAMGLGGGGGRPRPPLVALCVAIGQSSKGDCPADGLLQATMIPFVQPLPSALTVSYFSFVFHR